MKIEIYKPDHAYVPPNPETDSPFRAVKIGEIRTFVSTLFAQKFCGVGYFSLVLPRAGYYQSKQMLQMDNLVVVDEPESCFIAETIEISTDIINGDIYTISGPSAEAFLKWIPLEAAERAYWGEYYPATMERLFRSGGKQRRAFFPTYTDPAWFGAIGLLGKVYGGLVDYLTNRDAKIGLNRNLSILDLITAVGKELDFGLRLIPEKDNAGEIHRFEVRHLKSRRSTDYKFSPELGNLLSSHSLQDNSRLVNRVLMGVKDPPGIYDLEYLDAQGGPVDLETSIYARGVWGIVTNTDKKEEEARQNALKYLAENRTELEMECNIVPYAVPDAPYAYGTDYFLGDNVTVENGYGIRFDAIISEAVFTEDETGRYFRPSLSCYTIPEYEALPTAVSETTQVKDGVLAPIAPHFLPIPPEARAFTSFTISKLYFYLSAPEPYPGRYPPVDVIIYNTENSEELWITDIVADKADIEFQIIDPATNKFTIFIRSDLTPGAGIDHVVTPGKNNVSALNARWPLRIKIINHESGRDETVNTDGTITPRVSIDW